MSSASLRRRYRSTRHVCAGCREQPARFRYRGQARAAITISAFVANRSEGNRARARRLASGFSRTVTGLQDVA